MTYKELVMELVLLGWKKCENDYFTYNDLRISIHNMGALDSEKPMKAKLVFYKLRYTELDAMGINRNTIKRVIKLMDKCSDT